MPFYCVKKLIVNWENTPRSLKHVLFLCGSYVVKFIINIVRNVWNSWRAYEYQQVTGKISDGKANHMKW